MHADDDGSRDFAFSDIGHIMLQRLGYGEARPSQTLVLGSFGSEKCNDRKDERYIPKRGKRKRKKKNQNQNNCVLLNA
jgi:hypothetical protein